jgi:hypothetical protein
MIEVRAYEDGDLDRIEWQDGQLAERTMFFPGSVEAGPAFTILRGPMVLMIAGLIEIHARYASGWAIFAPGLGGDYAAIARAIKRVLDASDYRRIDAVIQYEWSRAHVLARLLGFELECINRAMGPEGEDFATYVRLRGKD